MTTTSLRPGEELAPAGLRLRPDPGARLLARGTVLVGGSPVRVLRLTPAGARHVSGWLAGTPVLDNPKARALARRLLDTGIAHPAPGRAAPDRAAPGGGWTGLANSVRHQPRLIRVAVPILPVTARLLRNDMDVTTTHT